MTQQPIKTGDVPGYEGLYKVTTSGFLYAYPKTWVSGKGCIRKHNGSSKPMGTKDRKGYLVAKLTKEKDRKDMKVHRLIAFVFIPNPENKPFINHINGIKDDNRVENLEWCTHMENTIHAQKMGFLPGIRGESNGSSKVKNQDGINIRKSTLGVVKLAKMYNMSESGIRSIKKRITWKHLK